MAKTIAEKAAEEIDGELEIHPPLSRTRLLKIASIVEVALLTVAREQRERDAEIAELNAASRCMEMPGGYCGDSIAKEIRETSENQTASIGE
jgi:hypothetical protein